MSVLGLDLGTSGLRALLADAEGRPVGSAEAPYPLHRPHAGWAEQDPAAWIAAAETAIAALRAAHPAVFGGLRGIAVAGHMHGATLLDAGGAVLRPCILWNDTRAAAEAAEMDTAPGVRAAAGNIVFPGFTAPKLVWVARHEPAIFARVATVLLPAAYLNFWLTGDRVGDLSDAAGTAWLDPGARDWSGRLLDAGGMRRDQMPALVEGCAPAGQLRADLARAWGLAGPVVVAGGAGDNAAAACGIGALDDGAGFVSLGTSGVILTARQAWSPAPQTAVHSFCHAVPGRWVQMGVMLAATDSLNWLARITGADPAALVAELGDGPLRPPGPVRFLPYLSGERTPHNDAGLRGAFTGLSASSARADLTRAVLEGVGFGLLDSLRALRDAGAAPTRLLAVGGGARSDHWLAMLASILDLPLARPEGGEFGAALGAARLALIAATGADPADVIRPPAAPTEFAPDAALAAAMAEAGSAFRAAVGPVRAIQ